MDESIGAARYWCHMCSQMVNPIIDVEIKCPSCRSGFVEEMGNDISNENNNELESDYGSERALSLWAPILLGMMGNPRGRRSRFRHLEYDDDEEEEEEEDDQGHRGTELDRELDSVIRRRRSSATILQLLQGIRAGMATESENNNSNYEGDRNNRERERERERERVILINPFNQTIVVQGGGENQNPIGSLGDYFVGPGLDLLLQHLAENDPNRYGTPPAQKEAVDALPTVMVEDTLQCSVCLDDFEVHEEAKEMPCKHKFHAACILPWLELHSSCPVCRHQLPAKRDVDNVNVNNTNGSSGSGEEVEAAMASGNGSRFSFPWPFNGLFSSQAGAGAGNANSSGGRGSASDSQRDGTSI